MTKVSLVPKNMSKPWYYHLKCLLFTLTLRAFYMFQLIRPVETRLEMAWDCTHNLLCDISDYAFSVVLICKMQLTFSTRDKDLPLAPTWPQPQSNMNETTRSPYSELPLCITNEEKTFQYLHPPKKQARKWHLQKLGGGWGRYNFLFLVRDITYPPEKTSPYPTFGKREIINSKNCHWS